MIKLQQTFVITCLVAVFSISGVVTLNDALGFTMPEEIAILSNNFEPDTNNTYDLGSYNLSWKDLYASGTAYISNAEIETLTVVTNSYVDEPLEVGNGVASTTIYGSTTSTFQNSIRVEDDSYVTLGDSDDLQLLFSTDQTPNAGVIGLGSDSNGLVIAAGSNARANYSHNTENEPTIFIQASSTETTAFGSRSYDKLLLGNDNNGLTTKIYGGPLEGDTNATSTIAGSLVIGSGSPTLSITPQDGSLLVTGTLEIGGRTELVGTARFKSNFTLLDNVHINMGNSTDATIAWNVTNQQPDTFVIGLGASNHMLVIDDNTKTTNYAQPDRHDATIILHSTSTSNLGLYGEFDYNHVQLTSFDGRATTTLAAYDRDATSTIAFGLPDTELATQGHGTCIKLLSSDSGSVWAIDFRDDADSGTAGEQPGMVFNNTVSCDNTPLP